MHSRPPGGIGMYEWSRSLRLGRLTTVVRVVIGRPLASKAWVSSGSSYMAGDGARARGRVLNEFSALEQTAIPVTVVSVPESNSSYGPFAQV